MTLDYAEMLLNPFNMSEVEVKKQQNCPGKTIMWHVWYPQYSLGQPRHWWVVPDRKWLRKDFYIQTGKHQPDIAAIGKENQGATIIDTSVPIDYKIAEKEKLDNQQSHFLS